MNDQSEAPKLWAKAGESVTCIKGHPICDISRDIYVRDGKGRQGSDFTNWQQPEPDTSVPVAKIRCTQCRGVWVRGNPRDGFQFHFADGWR